MDNSELITQLESYGQVYPSECKTVSRFKDLLSYAHCFDRSLLWGHLTASCWVVSPDRQSVLLLHHKKLDRWLQPGGHADGKTDLLKVAKKELEEETGLTDITLLGDNFFDLDIHAIPARKAVPEHEHFDVRFAFVANDPDQLYKNDESNAVAWINKIELLQYLSEDESLFRMHQKTAKL